VAKASGLEPEKIEIRMTVMAPWKIWREASWGWFYPNWCHLCDAERAAAENGYVGDRCRSRVRFIEPPYCQRCGLPFQGALSTPFECENCRGESFEFEFARASVIANETVRLALHQYKYHRALWMEPCLTQWLVSGAVPALTNQGWTCIVPVPLHSVRYREREFNQASRLAHRLGAALGIPVQENWIVRTAPTPTQTRLNRRERAVNVQGAFGAVKNASARNQSVIIVDDILTTGATTNAVAQVVRELGADRICVWTLARAVL